MSNEKSYNHHNNMLEEEETNSNESFSAWGNDGMNNATGHITTGKKYLFYAYIVACIVLIYFSLSLCFMCFLVFFVYIL